MSNSDLIDYNLPQNAYVAFDATTLKDLIKSRLDSGGKFTDQNYEGSNLAAVIDIIAYSYHVLLFYLNNAASESMFSQASLYENMNKIISLIDYKPTGKQTSQVGINAEANSTIAIGNYTIRKYSYFLVDGIQYTFNSDYSFNKTVAGAETIDALNDNVILYQGSVNEYPRYIAEGDDFEFVPIVVSNIVDSRDDRFVANGTISVYVKETDTSTYYAYEEVDNLYLTNSQSRVYDLRLNENGNFEVRFGNGIAGKKLKQGDEVVIFYILSNNEKGIISKNAISGNKLYVYANQTFDQIYSDITTDTTTTILTNANSAGITFSNPTNSTVIAQEETVEQIRQNVPKLFSSQLRLVTTQDYKTLITKSLPSVVQSCEVVSNDLYITQYIKYFYDISVDPNKVNRVLLNQVSFADTADFNNVNIFVVPKFSIVEDSQYPDFLSTSFKNLIIELTEDRKMLSHEVCPRDPIYIAYDLGFTNSTVTPELADTTTLVVVRENQNRINKDTIKKRVADTITAYFDPSNCNLGQTVSVQELTSSILNLDGVKSIRTEQAGLKYNGISLIAWNPMFPEDIKLVNQDDNLPFYKFPYLYRPIGLATNIQVVDE